MNRRQFTEAAVARLYPNAREIEFHEDGFVAHAEDGVHYDSVSYKSALDQIEGSRVEREVRGRLRRHTRPGSKDVQFHSPIAAQAFAVNLMARDLLEFASVSKMIDWFKRVNYKNITIDAIVDFVEKQK